MSNERGPREPRAGRNDADFASRSVSVPNKYYHTLASQPSLTRSIRSAGGQLSMPQPAPPKPVMARPSSEGTTTSPAAKAARIDVGAEDAELAVDGDWEMRVNYRDAVEGSMEWVVKAAKEEDLDKAMGVLESAIDGLESATHVGLWTGLPRSAFPRIIGSKGATISRLRVETGADIQVGKEDDLITITGGE